MLAAEKTVYVWWEVDCGACFEGEAGGFVDGYFVADGYEGD